VLATPVTQLLVRTGVVDPFIPEFAWMASIVGGVIFGVGMVIAQTCVSGMFYKLGNGMLGMVVAIAFWFIGDVVTWRGPLSGLRDRLNENPVAVYDDGGELINATLFDQLGWRALVVIIPVVLLIGALVPRTLRSASWIIAALTAAAIVLGWLLVRVHGGNYPFGTSRTPTQIWIRLEAGRRYVELAAGGFVMGVGAAIAGGCNLGHSLVGVPLLSLASIVTTASIVAGVFVAARLVSSLQRQTSG